MSLPYDDTTQGSTEQNPAVTMARLKLQQLHASEPTIQQEIQAIAQPILSSPHQQYMQSLLNSGKSTVEIQVAWHNYYQSLPDDQKHEVWEEFYAQKKEVEREQQASRTANEWARRTSQLPESASRRMRSLSPQRIQPSALRSQLSNRLSANGKLTKKHHAKTVLFMLTSGMVGVAVMMFGLFNEQIITPFMQPSRLTSTSPIIIDPNQPAVNIGNEPKVIIPKLNVEAPVVYDNFNTEERAFQGALEQGTVHYAGTAMPGQVGNVVIFGHSSNNILNKGDYKYVFVSLKRLQNDDTFILHKDGVRYIYKVFNIKIVQPSEVGVLTESPRPNMATLITCDPPGTAKTRLVVQGEQISPDPNANVAAAPVESYKEPSIIPSNPPSLFSRIVGFFLGREEE